MELLLEVCDSFHISGELYLHGNILERISLLTSVFLQFIFFTTIFFNRPVRYNDKSYPDWAIILGWSSCGISIIWIPVYMIWTLLHRKGSLFENLKESLKAKFWLPAQEDYRIAYTEFKTARKLMDELSGRNFEKVEMLKNPKSFD